MEYQCDGTISYSAINNTKTDKFIVIARMAFVILTIFSLLPMRVVAEEIIRSSSLHEIITQSGDIERKDYVDENGNITFASNMFYATVVKTKKEQSVLEEYFDEKGNPAKQKLGYYALIREYNKLGQDYKITYLDIYGQPTATGYGYATIIREYDDEGRVNKEIYLDNNGDPVNTRFLGCACRKKYDSSGRIAALCYLDREDNLLITAWGYAIVQFVYYESGPFSGRVKYEYYFDNNWKPTNLAQGQSGLYHEYDEYGRSILLTYLDAYGDPIITREGYTTIKRTYYPDDSVQTEFYYDINGNPARLSEGQYGILNINNNKVFLDSDGNELFNLRNYLYGNHTRVILFFIAAVVILLLLGKKMNCIFIALYCCFVLYMTIMHRESGPSRYNFVPFESYIQLFTNPEKIWETINNILLFAPLGTALFRIYPRVKILLIPLALSFVIEISQLFMGIGHCEIDDIINNGLGGLVGFHIAKQLTKLLMWINLRKRQSLDKA